MSRATAADRIFAMKLVEARKAAGVTQTALAKAASINHQATMWKIEQGDRPVTVGEAQALAAALNMSLLDLLDGGPQGIRCVGCDSMRERVLAAIGAEVANHG